MNETMTTSKRRPRPIRELVLVVSVLAATGAGANWTSTLDVGYAARATDNTVQASNDPTDDFINMPLVSATASLTGDLEFDAAYNYNKRYNRADIQPDRSVLTGNTSLRWHANRRLDFFASHVRVDQIGNARLGDNDNNRQIVENYAGGAGLRLPGFGPDEIELEARVFEQFSDTEALDNSVDLYGVYYATRRVGAGETVLSLIHI